MHSHGAPKAEQRIRCISGAMVVVSLLATLVLVFVLPAPSALAGRSSTGKLAFYPCTRCHPVFLGADDKPTKPLPNGFKQHEIKLEMHDVLGAEACLVCHDDPTRNPGKLILPDGTLVDITGDVSRVCQRCHFEKYRDWKAGVHGKNEPKCTAAGCHDPHTPSWIYIAALPPFQGTGIEVRAVAPREPFKPLAGPPVAPPVLTPMWLSIVAAIGGVVFAGMLVLLVRGRSKR